MLRAILIVVLLTGVTAAEEKTAVRKAALDELGAQVTADFVAQVQSLKQTKLWADCKFDLDNITTTIYPIPEGTLEDWEGFPGNIRFARHANQAAGLPVGVLIVGCEVNDVPGWSEEPNGKWKEVFVVTWQGCIYDKTGKSIGTRFYHSSLATMVLAIPPGATVGQPLHPKYTDRKYHDGGPPVSVAVGPGQPNFQPDFINFFPPGILDEPITAKLIHDADGNAIGQHCSNVGAELYPLSWTEQKPFNIKHAFTDDDGQRYIYVNGKRVNFDGEGKPVDYDKPLLIKDANQGAGFYNTTLKTIPKSHYPKDADGKPYYLMGCTMQYEGFRFKRCDADEIMEDFPKRVIEIEDLLRKSDKLYTELFGEQ